ncbi:MAG: hypothetical protein ACE1Y4_17095 [Lysobacterales bacterium]
MSQIVLPESAISFSDGIGRRLPLIQDAFWVAMALTMMFGTILTMVLVPTFYSTLYGIKSPGVT